MGKDTGEPAAKKKRKKSQPAADSKGDSKADSTAGPAEEKKERKPFSRPDSFSKAKDLQILFQAFCAGEVSAVILRPRLQTESVEHGRGAGGLRADRVAISAAGSKLLPLFFFLEKKSNIRHFPWVSLTKS
jgi:hypothetical protein